MCAAGLAALFVTSDRNLYYLSGHQAFCPWHSTTRPTILVLPAVGDPVLLSHEVWKGAAIRDTWIGDVRGYTELAGVPTGMLVSLLREKGLAGARIGAELGLEQRLGHAGKRLPRAASRAAGRRVGRCSRLAVAAAHGQVAGGACLHAQGRRYHDAGVPERFQPAHAGHDARRRRARAGRGHPDRRRRRRIHLRELRSRHVYGPFVPAIGPAVAGRRPGLRRHGRGLSRLLVRFQPCRLVGPAGGGGRAHLGSRCIA